MLAQVGCCCFNIPSERFYEPGLAGSCCDGHGAAEPLPPPQEMMAKAPPVEAEEEPPIGSGVLKPPFPRFHPAPTRPVFAPRQEYSPPQPLTPTPASPKPAEKPGPHKLEEIAPEPEADEFEKVESLPADPATDSDDFSPRTALNPPARPALKIDSIRFSDTGGRIPSGARNSGWQARATR